MADYVDSQKTVFYVGYSARGFEVSAKKATLDLKEGKQEFANEYQNVSHDVFLEHARDAFTLVNGKDKAGMVGTQRVQVQTFSSSGKRYVDVDLLIVRLRLMEAAPGGKSIMFATFDPLFGGKEGA